MAKDDLTRIDGVVTDMSGGGSYKIRLENGVDVSARLCGKMNRFRIRVVVGDKVTVGLSPYDVSHGLIVHRFRN